MTEASFETVRSVFGEVPPIVTVRTLGGRVREPVPVNALVPGGVVFTEGETALIIAAPIPGNIFRVDRKEHYYPVLTDPTTGKGFIQQGAQQESLESFLERLVGRIQGDWGAAR